MQVSPQLMLSADVEYQYGLKPQMSASNASGDFTLGSADILALGVGVAYQINPTMDVFAEYTLQRQAIGVFDTVVSGGGHCH